MSFSVICPTFNSEEYIQKTLSSVFNQTQLPNELILVDDGSTDKTLDVLELISKNINNKLKVIIMARLYVKDESR
mgnify:CR=1 FL=1